MSYRWGRCVLCIVLTPSPLLSCSHISSFASFPRLDPPPPSGKKRLPRALKTTQDMMISSDPVVSSPDPADSSVLSSPEKTPLIAKEEPHQQQTGEKEKETEEEVTSPPEKKDAAHPESTESKMEGGKGGEEEEVMEDGGGDADVEERQLPQLQLSVPDLINKDPPLLEPRAKPCDIWEKAPGPDSRLASTPRSGKTPCRISLGEEALLGNGAAPCTKGSTVSSADDAEPHPDLLSFE